MVAPHARQAVHSSSPRAEAPCSHLPLSFHIPADSSPLVMRSLSQVRAQAVDAQAGDRARLYPGRIGGQSSGRWWRSRRWPSSCVPCRRSSSSSSAARRDSLCSCAGFAEQEVPMAGARPCCISPCELELPSRQPHLAAIFPKCWRMGTLSPMSRKRRARAQLSAPFHVRPWLLSLSAFSSAPATAPQCRHPFKLRALSAETARERKLRAPPRFPSSPARLPLLHGVPCAPLPTCSTSLSAPSESEQQLFPLHRFPFRHGNSSVSSPLFSCACALGTPSSLPGRAVAPLHGCRDANPHGRRAPLLVPSRSSTPSTSRSSRDASSRSHKGSLRVAPSASSMKWRSEQQS
jgi:hypothetical protein